ncbi:MAG: SemiSWEET family sugar transporter [Pontiellaceae bacterium]|nr:SemiSWEET family sugar transporter [Pontiellaceae bacterium]MBN2785090.1 SemiSWEET family sugar transporter [Pontiellaceae bacterium]
MEWIGFAAALCTTFAFVPQVIHTWKTKDTSGISLAMYIIFVVGVSLWAVYGLLVHDWPIASANCTVLFLAGSVLVLKLKSLRS